MQSVKELIVRVVRKLVLPILPKNKRLPFCFHLHLLNAGCENELRHLDRLGTGKDVADVGANEGLFSYKLSQSYAKVYSFEINDGINRNLAAYNPGNIEIINKGLSSQEGRLILHIPVLNGLPLLGWASLEQGNAPGVTEHIEKPVQVCRLDAFHLHPVSFIKIDVEGHEVEVLKGAVETISLNRPRVLVEVKPQNIEAVCAFFEELRYQRRTLPDLIGVPGSEENLIFVPNETL